MKLRRKYNPSTRKFDYINVEVGASSGLAVFIQATEPTLASNQSLAVWEDTTSGRKLMIYRDSTGGQTLVELST